MLLPVVVLPRVLVGELIGTATSSKNGLLSKEVATQLTQFNTLRGGTIYKFANVAKNTYQAIHLNGIEMVSNTIIDLYIVKKFVGSINIYGTNNYQGFMNIKIDSEKNIYIQVVDGKVCSLNYWGGKELPLVQITSVSSFPSDAIDVV